VKAVQKIATAQTSTSSDTNTSDDWDTDIVQTKEQKTSGPVPLAASAGLTDIDDLALKT